MLALGYGGKLAQYTSNKLKRTVVPRWTPKYIRKIIIIMDSRF
jgi:hypothetical protein